MRGKFLTVEGIEGTGKSTNIDFLTDIIEAHGHVVMRTREPGGTPMAEGIRQLLLGNDQEPVPDIAELLLFFASRSLHLQNAIIPALERGEWVVCDRFTDASRAYQGSGRGLDMDRIERLAEWVQDGVEPDLTVLLDAPAVLGLQRAAARGNADRMDSQAITFYQRVRAGYLDLAKQHPHRFVVIDASGTLEQVRASVETEMQSLFDDNSV